MVICNAVIPSHDHCCVPFCQNRRNKTPLLSFHMFPKDISLKKKWIAAIKRDEGPEFCVTNITVICSEHFVETDYAIGNRQGSTTRPSRSRKTLRRLKKNAVSTVFSFRPLPQCRREPTVCVYLDTTLLPRYGPPTYTQWLKGELKATEDLLATRLAKESSKILELKTQILSCRNLVEQEKLLTRKVFLI